MQTLMSICWCFSLALDQSTDIADISHLTLAGLVDEDFCVRQELSKFICLKVEQKLQTYETLLLLSSEKVITSVLAY